MIEQGLVTRLLYLCPLTHALVGTRVWPQRVPQQAAPGQVVYPCLVYSRQDTERVEALTGPTGLARARIEIACLGPDYASARQTADALRQDLDGTRGMFGPYFVQACLVAGEADGYAPPVHADEQGVHYVTVEFDLSWAETQPGT